MFKIVFCTHFSFFFHSGSISANTLNMLSNFVRFTSCFHCGWTNSPRYFCEKLDSIRIFQRFYCYAFPIFFCDTQNQVNWKLCLRYLKIEHLPKINRSNVKVNEGSRKKHIFRINTHTNTKRTLKVGISSILCLMKEDWFCL